MLLTVEVRTHGAHWSPVLLVLGGPVWERRVPGELLLLLLSSEVVAVLCPRVRLLSVTPGFSAACGPRCTKGLESALQAQGVWVH